jgi:DNA-binding NarL/FixJ family response regulator
MLASTAHSIRVLLVEDHTIVRTSLRLLIEAQENLSVIGEADNGDDALAIAAREQPDIVLLDIDLGGASALDFLPQLHLAVKHARVIVLTALRDPAEHLRAVKLGALGLVLKDQSVDVLVKAIHKVHAGQIWLDPSLAARVIADMVGAPAQPQPSPEAAKIGTLTKRELEVIGLICEGLSNRHIGERLVISEATVRHHLSAIFNKLSVQTRLELVIFAYRHKLATPPA